jgi:hypothetical protein
MCKEMFSNINLLPDNENSPETSPLISGDVFDDTFDDTVMFSIYFKFVLLITDLL